MIKTSKHNISNISNQGKIDYLDKLFCDYKEDLITYINYILDSELPLQKRISSKILPDENIIHSKYKRDVYIKASEIIRSQIKKANNRRYNQYRKIYLYMIKNHPDSLFSNIKFSELNLNNIIYSKYFKIPEIKNLTINLTNEFFDIKKGNHFDGFISIKLPYFNEKGTRALKIKLPLKHHKHSNKLKFSGYLLKNTIQIKKTNGNYYINLIWDKPNTNKRCTGTSLGIDLGYKKLIATSDGEIHNGNLTEIYNKISNKQQGSKSFKRSLLHRDNEINRICNNLKLNNIKSLILEDLNNVKLNKKYYNNKIQRWSYRKTIDKLNRICMEKGIDVVKVSPEYTSQMCSKCGNVNKKSRKGESYKCISCGYELDADINASINIYNKGVKYSLLNDKKVLIT